MSNVLMMLLCFAFGYVLAVYVNKRTVLRAKRDIRYVNVLKCRQYNKGYKSALAYRKGVGND